MSWHFWPLAVWFGVTKDTVLAPESSSVGGLWAEVNLSACRTRMIGEGNGNPLQCACLENPRDGRACGLPSMGSHRVGHDWSDLAAAAGLICVLPKWLSGKESACQAEDEGSIPGSGRSPREGNGNPLQYSCLENSTDRGAWQATVHGDLKESDMTEHTHWILNHLQDSVESF